MIAAYKWAEEENIAVSDISVFESLAAFITQRLYPEQYGLGTGGSLDEIALATELVLYKIRDEHFEQLKEQGRKLTLREIEELIGRSLREITRTGKPRGLIVINSQPEGALIFLNGKKAGYTLGKYAVQPGQHKVEVIIEKYGHRCETQLLLKNKDTERFECPEDD